MDWKQYRVTLVELRQAAEECFGNDGRQSLARRGYYHGAMDAFDRAIRHFDRLAKEKEDV